MSVERDSQLTYRAVICHIKPVKFNFCGRRPPNTSCQQHYRYGCADPVAAVTIESGEKMWQAYGEGGRGWWSPFHLVVRT